MVAPTWLLMSSPTIGTPASVNFCAHSGSLAMNTGIALTKATPGVEAGLRVVALRLLRPDGEVARRARRPRRRAAPGRRRRGSPGSPRHDLAVVLAETVERRAAQHGHPEARRPRRTGSCCSGRRRSPCRGRAPTFAASTSKAATNSTSRDVVAAQLDVHEAGDALGGVGVAVVLDALDEAAGAVADTGDGDSDLLRGGGTHAVAPSGGSFGRRVAALGGDQLVDPVRGRARWSGSGARGATGCSGRRSRAAGLGRRVRASLSARWAAAALQEGEAALAERKRQRRQPQREGALVVGGAGRRRPGDVREQRLARRR